MTYGNGLAETRTYNPRLQPTEMRSYNPGTQQDTLKLSYGFAYGTANNGNVMTWAASGNAGLSFTRSYTYDELNRLKTMSSNGSICTALEWTYDPWGNRTNQNLGQGGAACGTHHPTINTLNRIADPGYGYDAAGNLIAEPGKTYQYDAENRLVSIGGGSVASYVYNAAGQRVRKIAGGTTTEYIYDLGGNVVAEQVGTTWTKGYVYLNGQFVAQYSNGTTYFVHRDHLGSTRLLTKMDKSPLETPYDYLPFGEPIGPSGSGTTHKFTGKERDPESSLDNFGARYYASSMGTFTGADPVTVAPERFYDPQQFNLYAYVRNSPLRFVDPSGETLTVSGNIRAAIEYLCDVAGGSCGRIRYDKSTNTVTIEIEGQQDWDYDERSHKFLHNEIAQNEGLSLLIELVSSKNHYDLFVGSTVETKGGFLQFDHVVNLDNNPDNRYNKTDAFRPKEGVDAQIAFDPRVQTTSNTKLKPATTGSIIFHELAEAYAKVDRGKQYAQAHQEAFDRESRLRDQRPYLKQHNPGAGPGDSHRQIQPTKPVIRR